MHEPIYRRALSRAGQLMLHHKVVWIFGVLSLLLGQLGWNNFIGGLALFTPDREGIGSYFLGFPWRSVLEGRSLMLSFWLFVILAAVSVLIIVVSVISEGALIASATAWFKGGSLLKMDKAWQSGVRNFWRLLTLHLMKKALLVVLLLIVNSVLVSLLSTNPDQLLLLALVVTVAIFLALVVATIGIFAAGYIVEREMPVLEAIRHAARLFREHMLVALELSLVLLVVQMGVVLLFMLVSTWFLLPFVSFAIIGGFAGSASIIMTGLLSSVIVFFVAAALIGGALNAFTTAAWMYLFMKMDHEGVTSKIVRFLGLGSQSVL